MGYAHTTAQVLVLAILLEVLYLAPGLVNLEFSFRAHHCDSSTVIAPVFQTVKPLYQHIINVAVANVAYYSAHISY